MHKVAIELEMPDDWSHFRLPPALNARLTGLLDRQDRTRRLTAAERAQAEELVNLAEMLSFLRLRAARADGDCTPRR